MFDFFKDLQKLQDRVELRKLVKRKDLEYELGIQLKQIAEQGDKLIEVVNRDNEKIIIYKNMHGIPEYDKYSLDINLRVITPKGIVAPDPKLHASFRDDYIEIIDIKIFGKNQNKGYGTILITKVIEVALNDGISRITGLLSPVDYDHIDRLTYFYKKNKFQVDLDSGKIEWINNNTERLFSLKKR